MYRLLYSILYEIQNSAIKPNGKLYKMEEMDFRELILLISQLGYIKGEIVTFDGYCLTGVWITDKGNAFLKEHNYLLGEYPAKSELHDWIREDSVYTRRI